jgi:hypothetical protein
LTREELLQWMTERFGDEYELSRQRAAMRRVIDRAAPLFQAFAKR